MRNAPQIPFNPCAALVADLHRIIDTAPTESALVAGVAGRLAAGDDGRRRIVDRFRSVEPGQYTQHVLYVSPDRRFSVLALVWGPGAQTCIHDHAGWCAVAVYEGVEHEKRYRVQLGSRGTRLEEISSHPLEAGSTLGMAADGLDIHRVGNYTRDVTVSLHVYGLDIERVGSSIKSRYDELPVVA